MSTVTYAAETWGMTDAEIQAQCYGNGLSKDYMQSDQDEYNEKSRSGERSWCE